MLADDGDIVDLNDGYCAMRFSNGVRIFSGNRQGSLVVTPASNGQVHANALYVNTSAGQIRTDLGHATGHLLQHQPPHGPAGGQRPHFRDGPASASTGTATPSGLGRSGSRSGDANPADPGIRVERRTPGAYKALATLCDKDGNATDGHGHRLQHRGAVRACSRRTSPCSRTMRSGWSRDPRGQASTTSPTWARTGTSVSSRMIRTSCSPAGSGTGSTFRTRSGSSIGPCSSLGHRVEQPSERARVACTDARGVLRERN